MSIIENKIISMDFDNKKFQKGISETISSLDSFTKKINGLAGGDKIFASLASSVEKIESKFNILHLTAVNVLSDIAMQAIQTGKQLLKSLSLDQITAGFQKFSNITVATSTILSAAPEKTLNEVEAIVERLSLFTDETSYNLETMVNTIGAFVSAGRDLDKSSVTMMGISTWAAEAGANAEQATRAMNQLSQALGRGYIVLQDWQSIQTLKMDTRAVKDQIIQAAEAAGTLKKLEDGIWETNVAGVNKIQVTLDNFSQTITQGRWLTTKVFEDAMSVYGRMAYDLMDLYSALTDDTVDFVESASFSQEAYDKLSEYIESENIVIDTTTDLIRAIRKAGIEVDEYGLKLFENAQVAKTWEDVINSVKDAASTQWSNIFKSVIGNLDEAKAVFTQISERLWDVFAGPINNLSSAFDEWADLGGRDLLFGEDEDSQGAVWNLVDALSALGEVVQRVIVKLFGDISGENLLGWTEKFKEWTSNLILNDRQIESWSNTIVGVIDVIRNMFSLLKAVGNLLSPLSNGIFSSNLISTIRNITNFYSNAINFILTRATKLINALTRVIRPVVKRVKEVWRTIFGSNAYGDAKRFVDRVLNKIIDFFDRLSKDNETLEAIGGTFEMIFGVARDAYEIFKLVKDEIKDILGFSDGGDLYDFVVTIFEYASGLKEYTGNLKDGNEELDKTRSIISDVADVLKEAFSSIWSIIERIKNAFFAVFPELNLDHFASSIHDASDIAKRFFQMFNMSATGPNSVDGVNKMGDNFETAMRGVFKTVRLVMNFASATISSIFSGFEKAFGIDKEEAFDRLFTFMSKLESLVDDISENEKLMDGLSRIFEGLFTILRGVIDIISSIFGQINENIFKKIIELNGGDIGDVFINIGSGLISFGDGLSYVAACIAHLDFSSFENFFQSIGDIFNGDIEYNGGKMQSTIDDLASDIDAMESLYRGRKFTGRNDGKHFEVYLNDLSSGVKNAAAIVEDTSKSLSNMILGTDAKGVFDRFLTILKSCIESIFSFIAEMVSSQTIVMVVAGIGVYKVGKFLYDVYWMMTYVSNGITYAFNAVGDAIDQIGIGLKKYLKKAGLAKVLSSVSSVLLSVAVSIVALTAVLTVITLLWENKHDAFVKSLITVGIMFAVVSMFVLTLVSLAKQGKGLKDDIGSIIELALILRMISKVINSLSLVISVVTYAIWALTYAIGTTEEEFKRYNKAVATIGAILGIFIALILTMFIISKKAKVTIEARETIVTLTKLLERISKTLNSLTISIILFTAAVAIIAMAGSKFGMDNVAKATGLLVALSVVLTALVLGLTAILKSMLKAQNFDRQSLRMSLYMSSISFMLTTLGTAILKIAIGVSILMAACSSLELSYTSEHGLSASVSGRADQTKIDSLWKVAGILAGILAVVFGMVAIITKTSASMTKVSNALGAAATILSTAIAVNLITFAIIGLIGALAIFMLMITDTGNDGSRVLNESKLKAVITGLTLMVLAIGAIIGLLYGLRTLKARTMLTIAFSVLLISGALSTLLFAMSRLYDAIAQNSQTPASDVAITLLAVVAVIGGISLVIRSLAQSGIKPMALLTASRALNMMNSLVLAIGLVFMGLSRVGADFNSILPTIIGISILLGVLVVTVEKISKIRGAVIRLASSIVLLSIAVDLIGALFIGLSAINADSSSVVMYAAAMSLVLSVLMYAVSKFAQGMSSLNPMKIATAFLAASIAVVLIGGIFAALDMIGASSGSVFSYAVSIGIVLVALAGGLKMFADEVGFGADALKISTALVIATSAVLIIGGIFIALALIGHDAPNLLGITIGIVSVLAAVVAAFVILNRFVSDTSKLAMAAIAIGIVGTVLAAMGIVIGELSKIDQGSVWSASAAVMAMIAVIGLVIGLMSNLNMFTMLGASASIAILLFSFAGAVVMIGNALKSLTENVNASKLSGVIEAISKLMDILWKFFLTSIIVTGVIAALSAIPGVGQLIALAAIGVLAAISITVLALSKLVEAIGRAILNLGTGIDLLATGLEKLHKVSFTLNETFVNIRNALGTLREIIKDTLKIIREAANEIVKTLAYIISQGIRLIAEVIASSFEAILEVIDDHKESVANRLLSLFLFLADTIASNGDIIGKAFVLMFDTAFDILINSLDLLFAKISGKLKDYVAHDNILRLLYWVGSGESIDDYITYAVTRREAVKMQTGTDIDKLLSAARGRGNTSRAIEALTELVKNSKELQSILPEPEKGHFNTVKDVVNELLTMSPEELDRKLSENVEGYNITLDFYKKEIKDKLAAVGKDLSSTGSNAVGSIFDAINKKWSELENNPDSALNKIKEFFGGENNGFTIDINANADGLLGAADDATDSMQKIFGDMDMDWGDIFDTDGLVSDTDEAMSALENRHQAYWVKVQQAEADSAGGDTTVTNTFYITSNDPEAVGRTINKQLAREKRRADNQW